MTVHAVLSMSSLKPPHTAAVTYSMSCDFYPEIVGTTSHFYSSSCRLVISFKIINVYGFNFKGVANFQC